MSCSPSLDESGVTGGVNIVINRSISLLIDTDLKVSSSISRDDVLTVVRCDGDTVSYWPVGGVDGHEIETDGERPLCAIMVDVA